MTGVDLGTERFRLARPGSEGYDKVEVDRFVAEVREALTHEPPTMAPWEVRDKRFRTQRVHRGYHEHDVDEFLDRAEEALREAHGVDLGESPPEPEVGSAQPLLLVVLFVVTLLVAMAAFLRWG